MHSQFRFAKTLEAYNYDYSLDCAIWAISLVHYWCTHTFQVANCNGFCFNAYPLGLEPDGSLCLSMVLYDPRTEMYVNNNATICLIEDVNVQILYSLNLFPAVLRSTEVAGFSIIAQVINLAPWRHLSELDGQEALKITSPALQVDSL